MPVLRRQHRRQMHQQFRPDLITRFEPHELKAVHGLLRRLLDNPDGLQEKLRLMAGEVIITTAYGLQIQEKDDPYVTISHRAFESLNVASVPGAFLVDFLPILKYVPNWMPFASFKRRAKEWRELVLATVDPPFQATMRAIESGNFIPSFVSYSLENLDETGNELKDQKDVIKATAAAMYSAGLETIVSIIASCILGFLSNPEALRKARHEIDSIVGTERLPTFNDRDALPYITAVAKEALRWEDAAPLGK
ncbi:hypothetical protein H0H81_010674 [Sphagnurus paluster]|uniref:Cytochrome P450 n=1 Tax=Sphagnurus paluster TaxID=117069 RepID=A0A9P7GHV8_9AGAR|nr:hypothetical protein H0H81_010674 [Sphagnurus paluster]